MTEKEFKNLKIGDSIYYFTTFDCTVNVMNIKTLNLFNNYVDINELLYSKDGFLDSFEITEKKCLLNYLKQCENEYIKYRYADFIKENVEYFI